MVEERTVTINAAYPGDTNYSHLRREALRFTSTDAFRNFSRTEKALGYVPGAFFY